eukprot:SAG11_NODE_3923_length_2147_cov_0.846680_1_plen_456_part_10
MLAVFWGDLSPAFCSDGSNAATESECEVTGAIWTEAACTDNVSQTLETCQGTGATWTYASCDDGSGAGNEVDCEETSHTWVWGCSSGGGETTEDECELTGATWEDGSCSSDTPNAPNAPNEDACERTGETWRMECSSGGNEGTEAECERTGATWEEGHCSDNSNAANEDECELTGETWNFAACNDGSDASDESSCVLTGETWAGGNVYYGEVNGSLVVEYDHVMYYTATGRDDCQLTFEVILKPTGDVKFQYLDMCSEQDVSWTDVSIGFEDQTGMLGHQFSYGVVPSPFTAYFIPACYLTNDTNSSNSTISMLSTDWELDGNCDIDVDECASNPCSNGATCADSTVEGSISLHAYQCTCVAGFANGVCEYDFITELTSECEILESEQSEALDGNCNIDVDECASNPCENGATCIESSVHSAVSFHTYQCRCVAGFANGVCEYDFISEYTRECNVW